MEKPLSLVDIKFIFEPLCCIIVSQFALEQV